MEFYKGYIPTRNKKPLKEFKDGNNFIVLDWARKLDEYAGVLAEGVILIDIDDMESSDIVLRILDDLSIQTLVIGTTRGKHFLFNNTDVTTNKTHTNTAIGITVDIKLGSRNSYHILKFDGVKRPVLRKADELAELPKWLLPVKSSISFSILEEGDGRNQALFNYILTLQSEGFNKNEIIETIGIINKYVLKAPLEQREIDTILRDEAFKKKSFFTKQGFQHQDFAKYLVREEHIVWINNVLHIYKDGIYSDKQRDLEIAMIRHIPELTQSRRREVLTYLELVADHVEMSPPNFIALGNGIYDLEMDELREYCPEIVIKNRISVNYEPETYDETVDKTLSNICCQDTELRIHLEEVIGYLLLRRNELGKFFVLTGSGSNGKSTFIDMLKYFLKPENYSALALGELGQRFKTAEVFGKLANLGDDISGKYIEETDILKKLVTGETLNVERKGKDPYEFESYAKLIFSANDMPRINDLSDGLKRRLVIIPFNAKFSSSDADFDPFIIDKLLSEKAMKYLLRIGIVGLKRVLAAKDFIKPAVVKKALAHYELENNPLLGFLEEHPKLNNELVKDVYLRYDLWCRQCNLKPLSRPMFGRELAKYGYKSKTVTLQGESSRVYVMTNPRNK
ncbi:phage/plasmid primase, P4 family, C-terminal domain protein [Desulfosporosinus acidiphilus SJ4]|uniref:Phage/plasmid primase, P4 family, C-terminal domain protein n=1 Tax=Desulfosporosinus acidiphilus (strain DSM 22704 / JCM 16185 / SJ4) TaxID=646529 RepID=I4D3D6_DESAJ|nr:DNA primase family protein [Desulfosporosinus acidiphilus]AFM40310.1 phage/plasmid primase, P4 family, C-terminal domain protein [Desulfosporosinus acidiphilus SJ4]